MHLTTGYENKKARIEMVPLIDVVFLLLVFFIYAMFSLSVHNGLRVSLPTASGDAEQRRNLQVTLTEENTLWFNGNAVEMNQCIKQVIECTKASPCSVMISGDRKADLGRGIELLSRLKDAGVQSVVFEVSAGGQGKDDGSQKTEDR